MNYKEFMQLVKATFLGNREAQEHVEYYGVGNEDQEKIDFLRGIQTAIESDFIILTREELRAKELDYYSKRRAEEERYEY